MVTATTVIEPESRLLGRADGLLTLRVRSSEHKGRVLRIRSPKCVVGSHASCTLRLRAEGVRPFHCVILRGTEGMFVRRWSADTCLNGAGFTEARLCPGDRLDIGPIELEVLEPSECAEQRVPIEPNRPPRSAVSLLSLPVLGEVADLALGDSPQSPSSEPLSPSQNCESCRRGQEREEVAAALTRGLEQIEQERRELTRRCVELRSDLEQAESAREAILRETERQANQLHQTRSSYQDIIDELRQDLVSLKERHQVQLFEQETLVAQAAAAEKHGDSLQVQLLDLQRQLRGAHEQADAAAAQLVALRQQHDERDAARVADEAELLQERQSWQRRVDQWEVAREELAEQLRRAQQQLEEKARELEEARERSTDIETQLRELQQRQQSMADSSDSLTDREQALLTLRRENDEQQHCARLQRAQWEATERQLQAKIQELSDRWQAANEERVTSAGKVTELESLLEEASRKLVDLQQSGQDIQRQRDEHLAQLSQWKDVAENLRQELQQEREQHQCARNEWHADRESLQHELAERSLALEQLQTKHNGEMQEAESLIHSLQQEGKRLLAQLDEAKQAMRQDTENRKKIERIETDSHALPAVHNEPPSRCQTMPMSAVQRESVHSAAAEEERDQEADGSAPQGSEEPSSTDDSVGDVEMANHTIMMSPAEFLHGDEAEEPTKTLASADLAGPQVTEPSVEPSRPEAETPAATETAELPSTEEQDQPEVRTIVLDPAALAACPNPFASAGESAEAPPESTEQTWDRAPQAADEPDPSDEEGVIQRYMERLLKRVASQGREECDGPSAGKERPRPSPETRAKLPGADAPVDQAARSAPVSDQPTSDETATGTARPAEGGSPRSSASRPLTPDMATDLLAMRELANHSARHAIHSSDRRRYLTVAFGELAVAVVCLTSSCLVVIMSPHSLNSQMLGGAIGCAFGAWMSVRGATKLFSSLRLKRGLPTSTQADDGSSL